MKTRSLIWAVLPGSALFVDASLTFSTKTKCIIFNEQPLCPGTTIQLDSHFATIMAGFPPNSKSIAMWKPKWVQTMWLSGESKIQPAFKYTDYYLADDECIYTTIWGVTYVGGQCVNQRYYGPEVDNPWHTLDYGPDGPVDLAKDPQHYVTDGTWLDDAYNQRGRENDNFDPEGKLPSIYSTDVIPDPLAGFLRKQGQDVGPLTPAFDNTAPPLSFPPLKLPDGGRNHGNRGGIGRNGGHTKDEDKSETDTPEKDALAGSTGSVADLPLSFDGIFNGDGGTDVASNLDSSLFANTGDLFNVASQADLGPFDSTVASAGGSSTVNDGWSAALGPSSGDDNLFAGDPSIPSLGGSSSSFLDASAGEDSDNLFAKRSPRHFRS